MKNFAMLAIFAIAAIASSAHAGAGYVGIGITLQESNHDFVVVGIHENGPAQRAGVVMGDKIVEVEGQPVAGLTFEQLSDRMKGDLGQALNLAVLAPGATESRHMSIVREWIEVPCFVEGWINLRLSGDDRYGTISGWVDNDYVNWSVSYGWVSAYYKNERLDLRLRSQFGTSWELSGWVHNRFVSWGGYGQSWNTYQSCIPN